MGKNSKGRHLGQTMKYFAQGLPKKQIRVLKALGPHMVTKGFYLAGGTALAIHDTGFLWTMGERYFLGSQSKQALPIHVYSGDHME
jgi:hypothetical protein